MAAYKSEFESMAAAFQLMVSRKNAHIPSLDLILVVARELVTDALKRGVFSRYEKPAFKFGDDKTVWFDNWPIGEWVSRTDAFRGQMVGEDLVSLRIFDPNMREVIQWWVKTEDRLRHEAMFPELHGKRKRIVTQPERDKVELPLCEHLAALGHKIRRQVKCADGRIDIFDLTANEIIECKDDGWASDITQAVLQLRRYEIGFSGVKLAVAVPLIRSDADWLAETLPHIKIRIIEVEKLPGGKKR